MIFRF